MKSKIVVLSMLFAVVFGGANFAAAQELKPNAVLKFWPVVEQVVNGNYRERIEIFNMFASTYDAGQLVVSFPSQVEFVSATPAPQSVDGNLVTFAVPALANGQTYAVNIVVKPDAAGQFVISEATYRVNGDSAGFMAAPANIRIAGAGDAGITDDTGLVAGASITGDEDALPRTGVTPVAYLYLGLVTLFYLMSAVLFRSKNTLV